MFHQKVLIINRPQFLWDKPFSKYFSREGLEPSFLSPSKFASLHQDFKSIRHLCQGRIISEYQCLYFRSISKTYYPTIQLITYCIFHFRLLYFGHVFYNCHSFLWFPVILSNYIGLSTNLPSVVPLEGSSEAFDLSLISLGAGHNGKDPLPRLAREGNSLETEHWVEDRQDNSTGLVQERRNSSVLAMELRLSCTNPSTRCNTFERLWLNARKM